MLFRHGHCLGRRMWETKEVAADRAARCQQRPRTRPPGAALIIGSFSLLVCSCAGEPGSNEKSSQAQSDVPRASRVLGIVERRATTLIELATRSGVLTTTAEHPFAKVGSGWTRADQLAVGDLIATSGGATTPVLHTRRIEGPSTPVFNLVVQGSHTYYVSEDDLLVHNFGCGTNLLRGWRRRPPPRVEPGPTHPTRDESEHSRENPGQDPRERARRWARETPFPGEWPTRPEPGTLGTPPTPSELLNLEAYRNGTKLRPPPGTPERRRLDEVEATVQRREQSSPAGAPQRPPVDPREEAKRWARETPWPGGEWPTRPEPGALGTPPTLRELIELEAYRDGSKLRPPPGTLARRRLDEIEALVTRDESEHGGSSHGGSSHGGSSHGGSSHGGSSREGSSPHSDSGSSDDGLGAGPGRAQRWLRQNRWPGKWPEKPEPGAPGTPPTTRELLDLESYRDGSKLRPPPGTPQRRRVDELESSLKKWEQSQAGTSNPEDPRARARRWARQVPWPGAAKPQ
jgi:hypothetical protein